MPEPSEAELRERLDSAASSPNSTGDTQRLETGAAAVGSGDLSFLAPAEQAGEIGRLGHYRIMKKLGQGGMGMVLLAEDTRLGRKVAVKVMLPKFAADPAAKERFLREARTAAAVKHDHIVTIYQVDEDRGVPYIALEYLKGQPLDVFLKERGPPPLAHVLRVGREIADGLAAAHAEGLIHRDIKPANIWLEAPKGRAKILDFGLARLQKDDAHLTGSGTIMGTPAFMAPEQGRAEKVDHRADLFSLGGVLYALCTGRPPFGGGNVMAVLTSLAVDQPTPVRELNPQVPQELSDLIERLLAKKPEERPQSAQEVAEALQRFGQPPPNTSGPMVVYVPMAVPVQDESNPWDDIDQSALTERASIPDAATGTASRRWPLLAGIGGVLALAFIAILSFGGKKPVPPTEPEKEVVEKPERTSKVPGTKPKSEPRPAEPAFFNGKDDPRWTFGNRFKVIDGELVAGLPKGAGLGAVLKNNSAWTRQSYRDFELSYQVRHKDGIGNSGVVFRCREGAVGLPGGHWRWIATGDRLWLSDDGEEGDESVIARKNTVPRDGRNRSEWTEVRLRCVGSKVSVWVDGWNWREEKELPGLPAEGFIGFRADGQATDMRFRNIAFTDLSKPAENTFFNGKDLTGWDFDPQIWRVANGEIVGSKTNFQLAPLSTGRKYRDFDLAFQVRLEGTDPRIFFRGERTAAGITGPQLYCAQEGRCMLRGGEFPGAKSAPRRDAEFNDVAIRCVGRRLTFTFNGVVLADQEYDLPPEGVFGWVMPGIPTEMVIRNIRFTDLGKQPLAMSAADVLTSPDWDWMQPVNLGEGVNGPANEYDPALTADGLRLIFASDRGGNTTRLYESRRPSTDDTFRTASLLEDISPPEVFSNKPWLSANGLTLVFTSTRPGGSGSEDIWMSRRASRDLKWGQPENLASLNSKTNEESPSLSNDGLTLYFNSNRPDWKNHDLWLSRRKPPQATWENPEPLGLEINTPGAERVPRPLADGSGLLFQRYSAADKSDTTWHVAIPGPDGRWQVRTVPSMTGASGDVQPGGHPAPSSDGRVVYFYSSKLGGRGVADLWMATRVPKVKPAAPQP